MFQTVHNRPLALHTPLGVDAVLLTGFRGTTGLSELFRFELDFRMPRPGLPAFSALLGQPSTVRVRAIDGRHHFYHGIVGRLDRVEVSRTHVHYQALLVPRFWLLTKRVQSRVYQQQSVPQILQEILSPLRPAVEFRLQRRDDYPPRDYCVQYNESDFAFASRLMEEEGLFYYFEHNEDIHTLIITDSQALLPADDGAIAFDSHPGANRDSVRIFSWRPGQEVVAGVFTGWDQCFELPDRTGRGFQTLEARSRLADKVTAGTMEHTLNLGVSQSLEVFEYPAAHAKGFDGVGPDGNERQDDLPKIYDAGQRRAARRAEAEAAAALRIAGTGDAAGLIPGHKFRYAGPAEDGGDYYVTRVEHAARLGPDRSGEYTEFEYSNRFECLPAELPYRAPARTPRPVVQGVQTATVVGPGAGEANTAPHVDKYGRVKVQFHWDRRRGFDGRSSCWVRVSQPWAGPRWGAFFWPRPGHEVVVAFEHGDPDCPLVTGSVYNAANMPPLELPAGRFDGGFTSCTPGGNPLTDFNCVIFHDRPGTECLHVHSNVHEAYTTSATRTIDTTGPVVQTFGRLTMPVPGSGGGGGHDDPKPAPGDQGKKPDDQGKKSGDHEEEPPFGQGKSPTSDTRYDAPTLYKLLMGVFGRSASDTEAGLVTDWKKGVQKFLRKELIGPWVGDGFPSKTEYRCGDSFEVSLLGKSTEHQIWGDKHDYTFAHPVDLAESVIKDFVPWAKVKDIYKYLMWGLKLGPEPSGNFEMLLGKKTDFKYYGPFVEVARGKNYKYEGEKFTTITTKIVDLAAFWLTVATYAAMSAADILGRKHNAFNHEGEVTHENWMFVNTNFAATKTAGILFELESENAKTHQGQEDRKRTEASTQLAALWATRLQNDQARAELAVAKQRLRDTAEALADITGVQNPLTSSTRKAHVYEDRYSLTARELTLVADDTAVPPTGLGNINITARKSVAGGGTIDLTAGDASGGRLVLQTFGSGIDMTSQPGNQALSILNDSPGKTEIRQGMLPGNPEIKLDGAPGADAITLSCGLPLAGAKVTITAQGIELSVGPPVGGAKIILDQSGITLKAGVLTTLKVTPAGVEIEGLMMKESFQTLVESTTLAFQEVVKSIRKESAPITNMM